MTIVTQGSIALHLSLITLTHCIYMISPEKEVRVGVCQIALVLAHKRSSILNMYCEYLHTMTLNQYRIFTVSRYVRKTKYSLFTIWNK